MGPMSGETLNRRVFRLLFTVLLIKRSVDMRQDLLSMRIQRLGKRSVCSVRHSADNQYGDFAPDGDGNFFAALAAPKGE